MSAIPTGLILEAVNRGEATLPALKQATGLDYPLLLRALEGDLSMAVRREETATGALRFHPLSLKPERKIERIPVGPFCVKDQVECRLSHPAGTAFAGEKRWICPKCKVRFAGSHVKRRETVGMISGTEDEHVAARERINEIIANGQRPPGERTEKQILTSPRTEAEDLCACGRARNHKGRHRGVLASPEGDTNVETEEKPLCAECGKIEAESGGTLCWDCDAAKIEAGLAAIEGPVTSTEDVLDFKPYEAAPEASPVGDMPQRWCAVHQQNELKYESLEHELAETERRAQLVTIEGGLNMNITLKLDAAEMATWSNLRMANFWEGLAKALRAVNGE